MMAKDKEGQRKLILHSDKKHTGLQNLQCQVNMIIGCIKAVAEAITGFNECVTFSQWFRSLGSHSNGTEKQQLKEDDILKLQTSFQCLRDTLPAMYNFINRVEWRSHEEGVAELLPELKAAIYDAEDLLEDFQSYELKVKIEGSVTSAEPGTKFFQDSSQDNFITKLTAIKNRLDNQSMMLERMGLHQGTLRFDRSVRPETTSLPTEAKIFGRDEEIKRLIKLLGVPANNSRGPSTRKRPRSDNTEATITSVPVLPIVGIGGAGKTTLAQNLCSHPQVKKHFDVIVWICISDDFDIKRLTKEVIEHFSGKAPTKDNLNSLQADLTHSFNKRRFLIVLDDMWSENGELWKTFYAPFKHAVEGSMMLVTTRSRKVADIVQTMDPFPLEGLKDDEFQKFFKLCVFGSNSSNNNSELEQIGNKILPKLKGSPLAAKTLGRLLGISLDLAHWNMILNSQLWELRQEETDILPALRLSYMYLPFYLKRCFSFCAVYPKDHNFEKDELAEIWVSEGFVEPEHNIPLQQTGCKYFEELVHLSFFQKLRGKYVMHDLIHDMAQLVSKDECFIVKEEKDLERIPQNVRHLSVLKSSGFECSSLSTLCKQTKLRTLLCYTSLNSKAGYTVMEKWCTELLCIRIMVCASVSESFGLPDSIGNMRNIRCLKILDSCNFKGIPATFCHLYNLQLFYAWKCSFWVIPKGFSNLVNLRKFESKFLKIDSSFNRVLCTCYASQINKDQVAGIGLMKEEYISSLTLSWWMTDVRRSHHDKIDMFIALRPPTNIKSVCLECYPGEYLPNWCFGFGSDNTTVFTSLTEIRVIGCSRLSSLKHFLQPAYMPAIKKMVIKDCTNLVSVPVERFGGLPSLEELEVCNCPKINSQCLLAPSLMKLILEDSGNLADDMDCRSLVTFHLSTYRLESFIFNREKLPLLTELTIESCWYLETLNGVWPILKSLTISHCPRLKWENGIVLPLSLQNLRLDNCDPFCGRGLENLTSLRSLKIDLCNHIEYIPRELWSSNLKSLEKLQIWHCQELVSIGGPEGIAHIPNVDINGCPKLKEVQQPLRRGFQ